MTEANAMKTAIILLGLLVSTQTITAGTQKTKNITGKVVDSETMQPISEVTITLADDTYVLGTLSNEKGDFRLWKVPDKCQSLVVSCQGYQQQMVNIEHLKESKIDSPLIIKLKLLSTPKKQISLNDKAEKK